MTLTIQYNKSDTKPCIIYICDKRCTSVSNTVVTSSPLNVGKPR